MKMPHTYIIIFAVVLFCALLTFIIPVGKYEVHEVSYKQGERERTRTVLDSTSFTYELDENGKKVRKPVPLFGTDDFDGQIGVLNYVFEGLVSGDKFGTAVGIVAFILVVGGAFGILLRTGAVDIGLMHLIAKLKGRDIILIPVLFFLFSLGGAVFGMGEEAIPFVFIVVPLVIALGYDAILGVLITYCATQIGFGTSWMNPFSLAVAQGVSGIPVLSGSGFRLAMWIFFTVVGSAYCMVYALKVKKSPASSQSYVTDQYFREQNETNQSEHKPFTIPHAIVLLLLLFTVVWIVWGVVSKGYYIPEIAGQFFVLGLVVGIVGVIFKLNDMKIDDIATSFLNGAKDLLGAALVVGMARGILIILGGSNPTDATIINTILFAVGNALSSLPSVVSAWFMYVFQSIFNFFVVSGSGQAALTMPIMAPLADIVGVSRQVAVLAFQLGDGFTNLIVPTSGILIASLGAARVPWWNWAKTQIKMQAIFFVLGSIFIIVAVMIGYN